MMICCVTFLKYLPYIEPFKFYEAVEQYQKTRLDKNRYDLGRSIIDKFIIVGSTFELNLAMNIRNETLQKWKQIQETNEHYLETDPDFISCPSDLFSRAQDLLFIELKQDNFPRFIQSDIFKRFLLKEMKKDDALLDKLGSKKSVKRSQNDLPSSSSSSIHSHSNSTSSLNSLDILQLPTPPLDSNRSSFSNSSSHSLTPSEEDDSGDSDSLDDKLAPFVGGSDTSPNFHNNQSTTSALLQSLQDHSLSNIDTQLHIPMSHDLDAELTIPLVDELSPYITLKDYQLALNLLHSYNNETSRWNVLEEKVGMKTAVSEQIYSFNPNAKNSNMKCVVVQSGIVPGKTREWLNVVYTDNVVKHYGEMFKKRFTVEYIKMNPEKDVPYPTSIIYAEAGLPFPITNRDFVTAKTIIPDLYDPQTGEYQRFTMIMKPTSHHEYPAKSSPIRGSHLVIYIVEKKSLNSVKYYVFETGDMAGKIPPKVSTKFFKSTATMMHKKIRKITSKAYETLQPKTPRDHDGGLATLKEYDMYLEKARSIISSLQQ